ncbi:hypothetical protein ACLOJK_026798 [Asimina triloba]
MEMPLETSLEIYGSFQDVTLVGCMETITSTNYGEDECPLSDSCAAVWRCYKDSISRVMDLVITLGGGLGGELLLVVVT